MSERRKSEVKEAEVLLQAVRNTSSSLELLREAVSNSVDALATKIDIRLANTGGDVWSVTIQDNGHGMEEGHMTAFFNAGDSKKDFPEQSIGEKGLGSKTTFVASEIEVESIRKGTGQVILGLMVEPLSTLKKGVVPEWDLEVDPQNHQQSLTYPHGTRIRLEGVRIASFNNKRTVDPEEIADRTLHYLRSLCATGTVKNRHAALQHIIETVPNISAIPMLTVEVVVPPAASVTRGPVPGVYQVPVVDTAPTGGPTVERVERKSVRYCDVVDFHRSRTITLDGKNTTVHYEGTAIIAGEEIRAAMLQHEFAAGRNQKALMGVHFCKDFIPMKVDTSAARQLTESEYYYEFKIFINSQGFQLNADRNVITNSEHDEVNWIEEDFRAHVWPTLRAKHKVYATMKDEEDAAIEASRKTQAVKDLKTQYSNDENLVVGKQTASLAFVKKPQREADVSHLLAMMIQSGQYAKELAPLEKFGRYIDASTDVICEDASGVSQLVEVEMRLPNLFAHKHPMQSYDCVVVWELGGMSNGDTRNAPWGPGGNRVSVALIEDVNAGDRLQWGTHKKPLYVLSKIV